MRPPKGTHHLQNSGWVFEVISTEIKSVSGHRGVKKGKSNCCKLCCSGTFSPGTCVRIVTVGGFGMFFICSILPQKSHLITSSHLLCATEMG